MPSRSPFWRVLLMSPPKTRRCASGPVAKSARASAEAWRAVGRDHEAAAARGVFGTPTLVFGDRAVFVKMQPVPEEESALALLEEILDLERRAPYVLELKQPEAFTASPRP